MAHRIFVDGAAGTTGLEILDRLKGRTEFELIELAPDRREDEAARREALVNGIPSSTYPDQLANGNFGGARSNVSSLGLPTFNYAHEACHGLLHCGVCATPCSAGAGWATGWRSRSRAPSRAAAWPSGREC